MELQNAVDSLNANHLAYLIWYGMDTGKGTGTGYDAMMDKKGTIYIIYIHLYYVNI